MAGINSHIDTFFRITGKDKNGKKMKSSLGYQVKLFILNSFWLKNLNQFDSKVLFLTYLIKFNCNQF